jgi:hypothetical protein
MKHEFPIIVRLQGGLGNQLYQYACGRALALQHGRPLLLDLRTILPEAPKRQYELHNFCIQARPLTGHAAWCTRWVGSVRLGDYFRRLWPPAWSYKLIRDAASGYDPSVTQHHNGPVVIHGYWQSYRYFADIATVLREDFRFKSPPVGINKELVAELESQQSVAVHVRRGDYVEVPFFNQTLGVCGPDYYQRGAEHLRKQVADPSFYVFTDDPSWAREHLKLPGTVQVVDHNLGKSDAEDLRLMSHCKHFLIANSSFSWWGAWLATAPDKVVIAPQQWFVADKYPPTDRIPSEWIRL